MPRKSDECRNGQHEDCDGCCLDSPWGCECECHDGDEDEEDESFDDEEENDDE